MFSALPQRVEALKKSGLNGRGGGGEARLEAVFFPFPSVPLEKTTDAGNEFKFHLGATIFLRSFQSAVAADRFTPSR